MAVNSDALMKLALEDFIEVESKILESPELITQKDVNDRSILHWAAVMGKQRLVELLLSFNECSIDESDDTGATPLILATLKGNMPICKMLIDRGANVNHQNLNGHTPVKYAGSKNHKDLLIYLLDNNGNPNARDQIGDTSLHRCASMEHHECLRILLTHPKSSPLIQIDAQNNLGNTALHLACECNDGTSAIMLIEYGASTEILNKQEATPLEYCNPILRRKIMEKLQKKTC